MIGKYVITVLFGFFSRRPARTFLVVAAGLSQIGEFSFILGQAGLSLGLINQDHYSLILAGALLSITVNPLMFRSIGIVEKWLQKWPRIWKRLDRRGLVQVAHDEHISGHVVVVGYGRVGQHIVKVLGRLGVPLLVMDLDGRRIEELNAEGVPTLFGDAANSEVMAHAELRSARVLVITLPEEAATEIIVAAAREHAPDLPIIARSTTESGTLRLARLGARQVIHPELEGGLQIVRRTLLQLGFPLREVQQFADAVRRDYYDLSVNTDEERQSLYDLLSASDNIGIAWLRLALDSPLAGRTLSEANLRQKTGASVVAIMRAGKLITNPEPQAVLQAGDLVGIVGDEEQIDIAEQMLSPLRERRRLTQRRHACRRSDPRVRLSLFDLS